MAWAAGRMRCGGGRGVGGAGRLVEPARVGAGARRAGEDGNNSAITTTACLATNESVVVTNSTPSLTTTASRSVAVAGTISDQATMLPALEELPSCCHHSAVAT